MKCILTKLSNNVNDLRTEVVEGTFYKLPIIGESFSMYSKPLDPNMDIRYVATSIVQNIIQENNTYIIKTLNSTYKLEVI